MTHKYFIQRTEDRTGWQSIFPAADGHVSRVHPDPDAAMFYMTQCGVPADAIYVVPVMLSQMGKR